MIVVIGILSATMIPSVQTNPVAEASTDLVSYIRYTQHITICHTFYIQNFFTIHYLNGY